MNLFLFLMYGIISFLIGVKSGRAMTFGRTLNLNVLASTVAMLEGKKKSISIAQIKEVIARTFDVLSMHSKDTVFLTVKKGN